jgi:hypothetical protein
LNIALDFTESANVEYRIVSNFGVRRVKINEICGIIAAKYTNAVTQQPATVTRVEGKKLYYQRQFDICLTMHH